MNASTGLENLEVEEKEEKAGSISGNCFGKGCDK